MVHSSAGYTSMALASAWLLVRTFVLPPVVLHQDMEEKVKVKAGIFEEGPNRRRKLAL